MTFCRPFFVVAVTAILAFVPASAEAAKKKGKKPLKGVVESVQIDNDAGSVDIKTIPGKKKGGTAKEEKFQVNKDTKVELLSGKRKTGERKPGTLSDIKKGSRILVTAKGSNAEKIEVLTGKKKGKKKAST